MKSWWEGKMTISQKKHGNISTSNYASFENVLYFYWKGNRMKSEVTSKVIKKNSAIK